MTYFYLQAPPHSLTFHIIKGYKELVKKIQSTHLDESASVVQHSNQVFTGIEHGRVQAEVRLDRAFNKLQDAVLQTGLRAWYYASKQRAKDKIQTASKSLDENYARYLSGAQASTSQPSGSASQVAAPLSGTEQQAQLDALYGSNAFLRKAVVYLVGTASQAYLNVLNTTSIQGLQVMEQALSRPKGQALITVSNHVTAMDDPLVMSAIIPPAYLSQPEHVRWTLCATDRCFKYSALVPFFRAGKILPVQRGGGMKQPGMLAAEARLAAGEWVHIFPEGTRSRDGSLGPVRKGVGRLVAACTEVPLVVPFVHSGMEQVMPRGSVLPAVGKQVKVLVGEPIPVADLLQAASTSRWTEDQLHAAISKRISYHLHLLKHTLDGTEPLESELSQPSVSSLDLFDAADLQLQRKSLWEKVKFKMQHRQWLQDAGLGTASVLEQRMPSDSMAEPTSSQAAPLRAKSQMNLVQCWAAMRTSLAEVKQLRDYSWQRSQAMAHIMQATT